MISCKLWLGHVFCRLKWTLSSQTQFSCSLFKQHSPFQKTKDVVFCQHMIKNTMPASPPRCPGQPPPLPWAVGRAAGMVSFQHISRRTILLRCYLSLFGSSWLYLILLDSIGFYLTLYLILSDCIWLYLTLYLTSSDSLFDFIWLSIWFCPLLFDYTRSFSFLFDSSLTLFDSAWRSIWFRLPVLTLFESLLDFVWPSTRLHSTFYLTPSYSISFCLILFDSIWVCLILFGSVSEQFCLIPTLFVSLFDSIWRFRSVLSNDTWLHLI